MPTDVLKKVKGFYETAVMSPAYQTWQQEAQEAWRFYDGEQWSAEEKKRLSENGQGAIVINKIAAKVDNIAGSEISGRTRILYRSRSGEKGEEQTAQALSDLGLYIAERSEQSVELSAMFKEGLITGIGWLDVGIEEGEEGPTVFNRVEDSLNVVWDPYAKRMDYSDARFVCREKWVDEEELTMMFPEKAADVVSLSGEMFDASPYRGDLTKQRVEVAYQNGDEGRYRVVEVQYKKSEKQYRVSTPFGHDYTTFDKKVAYASPANHVESAFVARVYVAYFSAHVLLSHMPLGFEHNRFTLVPYIYKRHSEDGRPYGLVKSAIDPQRELNKRRSKAMHLLNTSQVIADVDAVEDPNLLAREAARPDGVILKRPGKELRIIRNTDLAASQVAVMDQASRDIQEVIGVFDETIGKTSNATSGVAIHHRQTAGSLNQMFAFDALRRSKKALGMMVLALIRQFFTNSMVIHITDDLNAPRKVRLNQPVSDETGAPLRDANGDVMKVNDVKAGVFDVHVEEVRDVLSSRELEVAQLNMLRQAGVPIPPKLLVEATTLRNKEEIVKALTPAPDADTPPIN